MIIVGQGPVVVGPPSLRPFPTSRRANPCLVEQAVITGLNQHTATAAGLISQTASLGKLAGPEADLVYQSYLKVHPR